MVRDHGSPQKTDETYVTVTIQRDQGRLQFSTPVYTVTVPETQPLGTVIYRVIAAPSVR